MDDLGFTVTWIPRVPIICTRVQKKGTSFTMDALTVILLRHIFHFDIFRRCKCLKRNRTKIRGDILKDTVYPWSVIIYLLLKRYRETINYKRRRKKYS